MKINIFTLSENLDFCTNLSEILLQKGHQCLIFHDIAQFMPQIDENRDIPDIYIMDFYIYNHYVFNAYNYLKDHLHPVPLIFFNDPQKKTGSEGYYWKNLLDFIYAGEKIDLDQFHPVLEQIIDSISLLNESRTGKTALEPAGNSPENGSAFQKQPENLSSSEVIIYKMLTENKNNPISIKDLQLSIKKTSKLCRESTIACIISSLRKKLSASGISDVQIVKNGEGYRLVDL